MKYLQKLGKAIMLPVAVLPVAAIMMGIGYAMCPATMQGGDVTGIIQIIGFALVKIGSAVIDKLPMLFAVGVAIGLSKLTLKGALPLITICVSSLCLSFRLSNDHFIPHILLKLEIRLRNANVNKISVIDKSSQAPSL